MSVCIAVKMFSLRFDVRALQPGYFDQVTVEGLYMCITSVTSFLPYKKTVLHLLTHCTFTHGYSYQSKN